MGGSALVLLALVSESVLVLELDVVYFSWPEYTRIVK